MTTSTSTSDFPPPAGFAIPAAGYAYEQLAQGAAAGVIEVEGFFADATTPNGTVAVVILLPEDDGDDEGASGLHIEGTDLVLKPAVSRSTEIPPRTAGDVIDRPDIATQESVEPGTAVPDFVQGRWTETDRRNRGTLVVRGDRRVLN